MNIFWYKGTVLIVTKIKNITDNDAVKNPIYYNKIISLDIKQANNFLYTNPNIYDNKDNVINVIGSYIYYENNYYFTKPINKAHLTQ